MKSLRILFLCSAISITAVESAQNGEAAWAEIVKAKKANASDAALADQLKAFYKQFPDHPKASDAWINEQSLRSKAGGQPVKAVEPAAPAAPKDLRAQISEALTRIRKARAAGMEPALGEMERSGRKLAAEFPNAPDGWEILLRAAEGFGGEKARQLYRDIAANGPTQSLKTVATARIHALNAPPRWQNVPVPTATLPKIKPINLAFTAVDGRPVNLSQMTGKVVLIDFWATWCGPCRAEMPHVKQIYTELHDQGFEILGVSFDEDAAALKKYVAANELPWPQFFDGGGWQNAINKQFGIRAIPTMYLVDKNGILRDENARQNLAEKVRALLKE